MSTQDPGGIRCPCAVAAATFLFAVLVAAVAAAAPQNAPPQDPATPPDVHAGQDGAASDDGPAFEPTVGPQETDGSDLEDEETVAEPASGPALSSDLERAQATMGQLHAAGRALHAWVRDTRLERGRKPATGRAPRELRWDRCPPIGHDEVVELLVPAYLRELPEEDAWGRPLQFCLDRQLSAAHQQYGVRSPGSDGIFSGDGYEIGGFPESRLESDLVWLDGSFVRWAEPQ